MDNKVEGKKVNSMLKGVAKNIAKGSVVVAEQAKVQAGNLAKGSVVVANKAKDVATSSQKAVTDALDVNGDGRIDIEDVIILGMRTPGIKIDRAAFLQKEFLKYFPQEMIDDAIANTPTKANIPKEKINEIADDIIQYERYCVSGISAALSVGGIGTMAATLPADIAQYYGYMLRATQKLMYLYGFQQINTKENDGIMDSSTMNTLILCLGVMYGVQGANVALKSMATALAKGVNKKFMATAVTKGVLFPIVKSICKWFGVNLTKSMCTNFFSKALPVIGTAIGGTITYVSFKPCCDKLKVSLQDTLLSNPDYQVPKEEAELAQEIIDGTEMIDVTETPGE